MKRQLLLSLTLSVLAANAFAGSAIQHSASLTAAPASVSQSVNALAQDGSDRTLNRLAQDGSDRTLNRLAQDGSDYLRAQHQS